MAVRDLDARPEAVPEARRWLREVLAGVVPQDLRDDADLVLSELLGNAVLHAPGVARLVVQPEDDGVRLEVRDSSTTAPVRRQSGSAATTGRGLNLVAALASRWGVETRADGESGKTVWCLLSADHAQPDLVPDIDVDALLASFDDEPEGLRVHVGDAPVQLLREAKDHLDGVLRELALAEGAGGLPQEVVEPMVRAVRRFDLARGQLRGQITAAVSRGDDRVDIVFDLPGHVADSGEEYLQALQAADAFARDRRMLSLESPVEHRVLREWYVQGLVHGLRRAVAGLPPVAGETFEARLLRELHVLQQAQRAAERGARLQRVTARLAAADTLQDVARVAVSEGLLVLGADGGSLTRFRDGRTVGLAEVGLDLGLGERYLALPVGQRPTGPSTHVLQTGEPVWVESAQERDRRYPHLAAMQPGLVALATVPLRVAGEVVGALRFTWTVPRIFSDDERGLLEALAAQASQAVARADALQQLRALRDELDRRAAEPPAERTLELMGDGFFLLDDAWRFTYVNREAERLIGRSREQLLGRVVWEALPETQGGTFEQEYRQAVRTGRETAFEQWSPRVERLFEVRAHPGPDGLAVYFADVGERRATELERDRALARLGLLNAIGSALTATLDVDEALARLAHLLVPSLADLCSIDLRDGDDVHRARAVVSAAADPAKAEAMLAAESRLPRRHNPGSAVHQVLHGRPLVHLAVTPEHLARVAADPVQLGLYLRVDIRYACVVPLAAAGRVFGVLSLIRTGDEAVDFTDDDIRFAQDVGRRAGLMIDNAAQYTAQRTVAEGLQRSLLPELPTVPGMVLGAAYQPSSSAALVGGDWYDAFVLPQGGLGLVVGDVMGHDIAAAAAMGQLRSVLRTCAADGDPPALVLDRLDRLVTGFAMADLATVVYARLDRADDGTAVLTWTNAGHPPPLLLQPDGTTTWLREGSSIMIGVAPGIDRSQAEHLLLPGSTLLLFTDGLVERRGRDLDEQLDELAETAAQLVAEVDGPDALCSRLLSAVRQDGGTDDAAAVAVSLLPARG